MLVSSATMAPSQKLGELSWYGLISRVNLTNAIICMCIFGAYNFQG